MSTTTTGPLSTVIGVFPDHQQADKAIDELRRTHFGYDRIRLVERGTGGIFDTLRGMFTGQASMASSTADTLIKMGMPEQDARYYQNELDANHVLLLMNADDRPEEAFSIMRQNGAFDINSRLRMTSTNGSGDDADYEQNSASYDQNGASANGSVDPAAYKQDGTRNSYDPDANRAAPYTDRTQPANWSNGTAPNNPPPPPPAQVPTAQTAPADHSSEADDDDEETPAPNNMQETT